MKKRDTFRIKPAGRHILTIGRDLIQDCYAAVIELIKNAYDADSTDAIIEFKASPSNGSYSIIISDHGHGMSRDTIINKWMVPSTTDKLIRKTSPSGRIMQGRKGVGRYAASILGNNLLLETVTSEGEKTTVYLEWDKFENARFLEDVEILIETVSVNERPRTQLSITGDNNFLSEWNQKQFDKLRYELKKLVSPVCNSLNGRHKNDEFTINLAISGFQNVQNVTETIEPVPIFDYFDYRISGKISTEGIGVLIYSSQKARNISDEKIKINFGSLTGCGDLEYDIRVYDRESEAINSLIKRGLKDTSGKYLGINEARNLLDSYNGIGVYRNGFRIRPLGDAAYDWIELNKQRIQNPTKCIGSDQVIGYVQIQSEEKSGLVEKSARDGLKENTAYNSLIKITKEVIGKLEEKRLNYRIQSGQSRSGRDVDRKIEKLFTFDKLKKDIRTTLTKKGMSKKNIDNIEEFITRDAAEKNKIAEEIRQAVAIYQGQATLGKIINVILHEGRRPLNYFRNQIPNLKYWHDSYLKTRDQKDIEKIIPIADGIGQSADIFVKLFSRLDPLASGKRTARKLLDLKKTIRDAFSVFEKELENQKVLIEINGSDNFRYSSWLQDIYAIFTNLIDNSIYWMNEKNAPARKIIVDLVTDGDFLLHIDYRDTGPGIEPSLIGSGVIFEPYFTTKPSGAGLGLAIAGEAAARNGLELKAFESEKGAYFRLQITAGGKDE